MNRSIFIVIVDFLLLSLITFARFDSDQDVSGRKGGELAPQPPAGQKEVVNVLKVSLEEERQAREQLTATLNQTQDRVKTQEELLLERERRIRESQQSLQRKNEEAQKLAAERAALAQEFSRAQTNLTALGNRLKLSSTEAAAARDQIKSMEADLKLRQDELAQATAEAKFSKERLASMEADLKKRQEEVIKTSTLAEVSKERLAALEADLRRREEESARMQKSLAEVEQKRLEAEAEKQKLASQLQLTEAEKRMTAEQLQAARGEVNTVRQEKAKLVEQTGKLATGVSTLAEKTEDLTTEIRENRPLAANSIYNDFLTNRLQCFIQASRHGVFGQTVDRQKESKTLLVNNGTNTYAILHVDDTPLSFAVPGTDWRSVTGSLRKGPVTTPIAQLYFWASDPRIIIIPIAPNDIARWAMKTYPVASDPYKFQEAILVGASESYYGECKFQIDPANPRYVRMDRNLFKRMVGAFSPSAGDLVLSKTGQVIGVMVNKEYCAVLNNFGSLFSIRTGPDVASQQTGTLLAAMQRQLEALPLRLQ